MVNKRDHMIKFPARHVRLINFKKEKEKTLVIDKFHKVHIEYRMGLKLSFQNCLLYAYDMRRAVDRGLADTNSVAHRVMSISI